MDADVIEEGDESPLPTIQKQEEQDFYDKKAGEYIRRTPVQVLCRSDEEAQDVAQAVVSGLASSGADGTPLDDAYDWFVRITVEGIDCYSVGAEDRSEAESLRTILESADGVDQAEIVQA